MRVLITQTAFSPEKELSAFAAERKELAGALASFVGYCRGGTETGAVMSLNLQHYPGFSEAEIKRLAQSVSARHDLLDLFIIHRVGAIGPSEPIVLVAALSSHRQAAFAAVGEMMDYLKTDAPIWKQEIGANGARWIEPTAEDQARRKEHEK